MKTNIAGLIVALAAALASASVPTSSPSPSKTVTLTITVTYCPPETSGFGYPLIPTAHPILLEDHLPEEAAAEASDGPKPGPGPGHDPDPVAGYDDLVCLIPEGCQVSLSPELTVTIGPGDPFPTTAAAGHHPRRTWTWTYDLPGPTGEPAAGGDDIFFTILEGDGGDGDDGEGWPSPAPPTPTTSTTTPSPTDDDALLLARRQIVWTTLGPNPEGQEAAAVAAAAAAQVTPAGDNDGDDDDDNPTFTVGPVPPHRSWCMTRGCATLSTVVRRRDGAVTAVGGAGAPEMRLDDGEE